MCLKKGCYLFKHTKKECDKSKNWFKEQFGQQFNKKTAQYIDNFKKTEFNLNNNLDDKGLDEIKALLINVLSPPSIVFNNKNSETFFTLLGFIETAGKRATNFANRLFSHFFTTICNVLPNYINSANTACKIINSNPFAYIVTN